MTLDPKTSTAILPQADDDTSAGVASAETMATIQRGILHCRRGEWHVGLHQLMQVDLRGDAKLPGLFYSYLGHALARCERRHAEGIALCERAVASEFFQPENFLNRSWARRLSHDRKGAMEAVQRGLHVDPAHAGLREMEKRLGRRNAPVIRFLPRGHALNRRLGRLRAAWRARRDED